MQPTENNNGRQEPSQGAAASAEKEPSQGAAASAGKETSQESASAEREAPRRRSRRGRRGSGVRTVDTASAQEQSVPPSPEQGPNAVSRPQPQTSAADGRDAREGGLASGDPKAAAEPRRTRQQSRRTQQQEKPHEEPRRPVEPMPSALRPQNSATRGGGRRTEGADDRPGGKERRRSSSGGPSSPTLRTAGRKGSGDAAVRHEAFGRSARAFALQFAVVFLGVLVTFVGSGIIERWRQARAVRTTMQLVAGELEYNLDRMRSVCDKLRFDRRGMLMFERCGMDPDRIPEDSLVHYAALAGGVRTFSLQDDALEVLKTSGLASSVEDKRLLMELLGCYREMEDFRDNVAAYNRRKIEAIDHLFAGSDLSAAAASAPRDAWRTMLADPMFANFIASSSTFFGGGDETYFDRLLGRVETTLRTVGAQYGAEGCR